MKDSHSSLSKDASASTEAIALAIRSYEGKALPALEAVKDRAGGAFAPIVECIVGIPRALGGMFENMDGLFRPALRKALEDSIHKFPIERIVDRVQKQQSMFQDFLSNTSLNLTNKIQELNKRLDNFEKLDEDSKDFYRRELTTDIKEHLKDLVTKENGNRYRWAYGVVAISLAGAVGLGMIFDRALVRAFGSGSAISALAALQTQAAASQAEIAKATSVLTEASNSAQPGLAFLMVMSALPIEEREALNTILEDIARGARSRNGVNVELAALRDAMKMPAGRRRMAVSVAQHDNLIIRELFVDSLKLSAERGNIPWFPGDMTNPGCLMSGPNLPSTSGVPLHTCLVQLPEYYQSYPDTMLRRVYGVR